MKDNPIKAASLFHTPANMKELQDILSRYTAPGEGIIAMTCAYMAWNLASKIIDEKLAEEH